MDIALGTKRFLLENKTLLVWVAAIAVFLTIAITVKEVTALLLLAYAVSVLLDPLIERLESHKLSRQSAVLVIGGSFLLALLILLIVLAELCRAGAGTRERGIRKISWCFSPRSH